MCDEPISISIAELEHLATQFLEVGAAHEAHLLAIQSARACAATARTQAGLGAGEIQLFSLFLAWSWGGRQVCFHCCLEVYAFAPGLSSLS